MNLGFIGAGNMGGAVLRAAVRSGLVQPKAIFLCRRHPERGTGGLPEGVRLLPDAAQVARQCERIVLAVKPQQAEAVLREMGAAASGRFVLSVMAGWDFARLKAALPKDARVLPVMPNTPLSVGEGMTLFSEETDAEAEELSFARALFSSAGRVETVSPAAFDAANAISGCGPAFAYLFAEALCDGAVAGGLPRDTAYRLAGQMLLGAGKMILESGKHPGALKDAVCSPGGSTIRGVYALEKGGARAAAMDAVAAVIRRTKEMSRGL